MPDQRASLIDLLLSSCRTSQICLGNSDHPAVLLIFLLIPLLDRNILFTIHPIYNISFRFQHKDWDLFPDIFFKKPLGLIFLTILFRIVPQRFLFGLMSMLKLSRKYLAKRIFYPLFTPACSVAIAYRHDFFRLYQHYSSDYNRSLFVPARNTIASNKTASRDY